MTLMERVQTMLREAALDAFEQSGQTTAYAVHEAKKAPGLRAAVQLVARAFREHENDRRAARRRSRRRQRA
jgi:hypothetical protein